MAPRSDEDVLEEADGVSSSGRWIEEAEVIEEEELLKSKSEGVGGVGEEIATEEVARGESATSTGGEKEELFETTPISWLCEGAAEEEDGMRDDWVVILKEGKEQGVSGATRAGDRQSEVLLSMIRSNFLKFRNPFFVVLDLILAYFFFALSTMAGVLNDRDEQSIAEQGCALHECLREKDFEQFETAVRGLPTNSAAETERTRRVLSVTNNPFFRQSFIAVLASSGVTPDDSTTDPVSWCFTSVLEKMSADDRRDAAQRLDGMDLLPVHQCAMSPNTSPDIFEKLVDLYPDGLFAVNSAGLSTLDILKFHGSKSMKLSYLTKLRRHFPLKVDEDEKARVYLDVKY